MSDDHQPRERKPPTSYDELFPGRFLKAGLLRGRPVTLTIAAVHVEDLPQDDGGSKTRGIVSFAETPMQLVLNRTNADCFKGMWGAAVQEWVGHRVTLGPEEARFGRDKVQAIRVLGSPELEAAVTVEIKLPRRKPQSRTLRPTGRREEVTP